MILGNVSLLAYGALVWLTFHLLHLFDRLSKGESFAFPKKSQRLNRIAQKGSIEKLVDECFCRQDSG